MDRDSLNFDVLILGGGFAGVYAAKELGKYSQRNKGFKVGMVSEENYMVFQPMLPSVAAASISPRHVINPIRQLCKSVDVFKGKVIKIDAKKKSVFVNAGDFTLDVELKYKKLIVTLGSKTDLSRVPGMSEHSLLIQNVGDAMKLRAQILSRFEEANIVYETKKKRKLLSFVVVGGGYSGVETAGEILDLMSEICKYYENISEEDFKVTLIHSGDHLLESLSKKLGIYCQKKLTDRGLDLILNQRVKAVTAESVVIQSGKILKSNTVISTVGNAPNPVILDLIETAQLRSKKGRLKTDLSLNVDRNKEIWAAGDCAAIPFPNNDETDCPATAQFAQRQGVLMAKNIISIIKGNKPSDFKFKGLGEMAAIGHRNAVAEIFGFSFSGFFAWWMWRTVYLSKLPGFQKKLRIMIDWTFDLFFPRDINLLSPQYSKPLKDVYLEANDILFNAGEPAFSIYFVKSGKILIKEGNTVVKEVGEGEYFGESALLQGKNYRFQAVATEASNLIALAAPEFKAIVSGSSDLQNLFERSARAYESESTFNKLSESMHEDLFKSKASDIMLKHTDTIQSSISVHQALTFIQTKPHGSYPVLEGKKYLGSLKRDMIYDVIKSEGSDTQKEIKELRLTLLPQTSEDTSGKKLLQIMNRSGKNKVIILNREKEFAGIITIADLLNFRQ